ncbi:hypothetical protein ACLB2K_033301 [Fragaria x ananassa]
MAGLKVVFVVLTISFSLGGNWVGAQVHHVVGGDRGWDPANSDLTSWSSGKSFMVGDTIWFAYSAAHGFIAEVNSKEEFDSCDVSNPIRMFKDGLDSTPMDKEGLRYFTSSNPESCKNGLKLHVQVVPYQDRPQTVMPVVATSEISALAAAEAPSTPSGSAHLGSNLVLLSIGFALLGCVMGL